MIRAPATADSRTGGPACVEGKARGPACRRNCLETGGDVDGGRSGCGWNFRSTARRGGFREGSGVFARRNDDGGGGRAIVIGFVSSTGGATVVVVVPAPPSPFGRRGGTRLELARRNAQRAFG
jgi:hypothetical protein